MIKHDYTDKIVIFPFDFSDEILIQKAINLLNEGTLKKKHTREFWDWRFANNPFGESYGWYAKDTITGDLAGILLWWPWKFNAGKQDGRFYQAINGKISEKYRHRKIFLRLNNTAIDFFQDLNAGLFGFPNENSYPGYQKLGWMTFTRINPFLIPLSPVRTLLKFFLGNKEDADVLSVKPCINFRFKNLESQTGSFLTTLWNVQNLTWRFQNHPAHEYCYFNINDSLFIYRTKKRSRFIEAQVVFSDIVCKSDYQQLKKHLRKRGVDFLTYFGFNTLLNDILRKKIFKLTLKKNLYFIVQNSDILQQGNIRLEMAETDSQ